MINCYIFGGLFTHTVKKSELCSWPARCSSFATSISTELCSSLSVHLWNFGPFSVRVAWRAARRLSRVRPDKTLWCNLMHEYVFESGWTHTWRLWAPDYSNGVKFAMAGSTVSRGVSQFPEHPARSVRLLQAQIPRALKFCIRVIFSSVLKFPEHQSNNVPGDRKSVV